MKTNPILFVILGLSLPVCAATLTWDYGATTSNWGDANNWSPNQAPVGGDSLVYNGTSNAGGFAQNNNLAAGTQINGFTFNNPAGGFTISGSKINLAGDITDTSTNGSVNQTFNIDLDLVGASRTFSVTSPQGLVFNGVIGQSGGTYGVTKAGTGTMTVTKASTYAGATTISGGTLALSGGNNRLPTTTSLGFTGTSTLNLGGNDQAVTGFSFTGSLTGTITGGGSLQVTGSTAVNVGYNSGVTATLSVIGTDVIFTPDLFVGRSESGAASSGTGTLLVQSGSFSAPTLYLARTIYTGGAYAPVASGTLTIDAGTVKIRTISIASSNKNNSPTSATLNLNNGGVLYSERLQTSTAGSETITFNWNDGTLRNFNASSDLTIDANFNGGFKLLGAGLHAFDMDVGRTGTVNQGMSGDGALTKQGDGVLTLTAANTYTGTTTVSAGTLTLSGASSRIGSSAAVNIATGAVLNLSLADGSGSNNALTSAAAGTWTISGTLHSTTTAANTMPGYVILNNGTLSGSQNAYDPYGIYYGGNATTITANGSKNLISLPGANAIGLANTLTLTTPLATDVLKVDAVIGTKAGTPGIIKSGPGTVFLSKNNSFTGGTTVSNGTLIGTGTSALGTNSGLTVANGATFAYRPGAAGALGLGTGVINLATGSRIGTVVSGTAGQSAITSSGAAVTTGTVTVDISGIPGVAPTAGSNNLITAAGGGLAGATYTLGNVYNASNFTVSGLTSAANAVSVTVTGATALANTYWKGGYSGGNNVWAVSNGSTTSNWASDAGGTDTSLTPGPTATVNFSATGATNQGAMVLGANMSIGGVVVGDASTVALNADGFTLTTGTGGITVNSGAGAVSLAAPIVLGGAQAWTNNNGSNPLTVSGTVANAGYLLTTGGTGDSALSGVLSGTGGLTKSGTGTATLSGVNTYTGATTVSAGTMILSGGSAIANTGAVSLADAAGVVLQLNASETIGSLAGGGASGGTVNLGANTLTSGDASTTSFSGVISGSGGSLTKLGTGTFTLSGGSANTFSGTTTVYQGALVLNKSAGVAAIGGDLVFDNNLSPDVYTLTNNQFAPGTVVRFVNDAGDHGRFELIGTTQTVAGIDSSSYGTVRGVIQNREAGPNNTGTSTLILNGSGSYLFGGYLRNSTGTLALTMAGTGTQTLRGTAIDYTGTTAVNSGTLRLSVTTGYASATTVASGAILELAGAANAEHASWTGSALRLNDGATLNKTNTGYDTINSGNVIINGTTAINIINNGSSNQLLIGGSGGTGLTGTGALTLTNTGTTTTGLTLRAGVNAVRFNGAMTVVGGALNIGSGASLALDNTALTLTGARMTLDNSAFAAGGASDASVRSLAGDAAAMIVLGGQRLTLGTNNGTGASFAGVISGTGGVTKTGTGTQTLSGLNTYTGATQINQGTINLTGALAGGTAITVNNAAVLTQGAAGVISGAASITHNSISTSTLAGLNTYTGATTFGAGVLKLDLSTNPTGVLSASSTPTLSGGTLLVQGKSTGTSTQTMGNLTLAANTSGVVKVDPNSGASTTLTLGNAWVRNTGSSVFFDLSAGTPATAIIASSPTLTNSIIGGWATIKDNTGTGFATVSAGKVVRYTAGSVLMSNSNSATTNFTSTPTDPDYSAGTLTMNLGTHAVNTVAFNSGAGGALNLNSQTMSVSGGLLFDGTGNYAVTNGVISGAGATLAKFGSGTLTLSAASTYTGATTVHGGTLKAGVASVANVSGAFGNNSAVTLANAASTNLDITGFNTQIGSLAGGGASGGNVILGAATLTTGGNNTSTTFAGVISGAGGGLTKIGTGTLTLSGGSANTYTGMTTVSGVSSTLVLNKTAGVVAVPGNLTIVGAGANYSKVFTLADNQFGASSVINFTTANYAILDLLGTTQTVAGVNSTSTYGIIENSNPAYSPSNSGTSTLVLNGSATYDYVSYMRDQTGTLALTKSGSGTQTLGGANITYTGATTVSGGKLKLDGTTGWNSNITNNATVELAASSNWALNSGTRQTLSGSGIYVKSGSGIIQLFNDTIAATGQFLIQQGTLKNDGNSSIWTANTADMDISAGATLDLYADDIYVDALTGAGTVDNGYNQAQTLIVGVANGSGTFSGVIKNTSNSLSLRKAGSGTQILSGTSSYSGSTTIDAGTLQIGNGGATGTIGSGAVVNNAALVFNRTGTGTVAGAVSGAGTLLQSGAGTTILAANNSSMSGTVTISAGTLQIGAGSTTGTLGTSPVEVNSALVFNRSNDLTVSNTISGTGTLTKMGAGIMTLNGTSSYAGTTFVNSGTLRLDYTGAQTTNKLHDGAVLVLGGGTLDLAGGSHTEVVASTLLNGGSSGVTRSSGTGILQMNAISRTTGGTVNFGAANIASTDTLNDASGILGAWATVGNNWAVNSTNGADGLITAYAGPYTELTRLSSGGKVIPDSLTAHVRVTDGTGSIGNITLAAPTSTIGTLKLETTTSAATMIDNDGKVLRFSATGGILMTSTSGALVIGTNPTISSTLTSGGTDNTAGDLNIINNSTYDLTINSVIANNGSGAVSLVKTGTGTMHLRVNNTYTGATVIGGGIVQVGNNNTTGSLGNTSSIINNGTLKFHRSDTTTLGVALTGTGTLVVARGGTLTLASGATVEQGNLYMGDPSAVTLGAGTLNVQSGASLAVTGEFILGNQASGPGTVNQSGGTVNLTTATADAIRIGHWPTGTSVYNLTGGTLNATAVDTTLSWDGNGILTVNGGTANLRGIKFNTSNKTPAGTVNLTSGTLNIGAGGITDGSTGANGTIINLDGGTLGALTGWSSSLAMTLVANKTTTMDTTGGDITLSGILSNSGNLIKDGSNKLTLSGANSFTGTTAVNGGTLQIGAGSNAGTLGNNSAVTIGTNGTLTFFRNDAELTIANSISGSGDLVFQGTGATGQSAYNANGVGAGFTGDIIVNSARLQANANTSTFGNAASITVNSGASLAMGFASGPTIATPLTLTGTGWLETGGPYGALRLENGATASGPITLAGNTTILSNLNPSGGGNVTGSSLNAAGYTLTLDTRAAGQTLTVSAPISGLESSLVKTGAGIAHLTGLSSFNGDVTLSAGTLKFNSANNDTPSVNQALGIGPNPVTMSDNTTLEFTGASGTLGRGITLPVGAGTIGVTSGTLTLSGATTLRGGGVVSTFRKSGAGTLDINGSEDWNGTGYVDAGTFRVSGGSFDGGNWTVATAATFHVNGGQVTTPKITSDGAIHLEAGTLRVAGGTLGGSPSYSIDIDNNSGTSPAGTFTWGAGTLAVYTAPGAGESGQTDRTSLAGSPAGPVVREGNYLYVDGTVVASSGSVLDLGSTFISNGLRYNQLNVNGSLTLSGGTLNIGLSPYFLRPDSPNSITTGDWGTLILAYAGDISGTFASYTGIVNDPIGWMNLGVGGAGIGVPLYTDPEDLPINSYYIEYRDNFGGFTQSGGDVILFHYKVAGTVPEPSSALIMIAGIVLLRTLSRRKFS